MDIDVNKNQNNQTNISINSEQINKVITDKKQEKKILKRKNTNKPSNSLKVSKDYSSKSQLSKETKTRKRKRTHTESKTPTKTISRRRTSRASSLRGGSR